LYPADTLSTVLDRFDLASSPVLPVVDQDRRLLGVVNLEEAHLAARSPHAQVMLLAADLMRDDVIPLRPEHGLDRAVELFALNNLNALPVVNNRTERRLLGLIRRGDIAAAYLRRVHGQFRDTETL
jgi:CIC family chloride channel protein